jgi:hypothetical protein
MTNTIKILSPRVSADRHYLDDDNVLRWLPVEANSACNEASYHKPLLKYTTADNVTMYFHGTTHIILEAYTLPVLRYIRDYGRAGAERLIDVLSQKVADENVYIDAQKIASATSRRRKAILNEYRHLSAIGYGSEPDIVECIAAQLYCSPRTITNALEMSGVGRVQAIVTTGTASKVNKKTFEYGVLRHERGSADNRARQAKMEHTMSMSKLLINNEVPIVCPVFGIKLNYHDPRSLYAVRVWCKDPAKGLVDDNYCAMSKAAADLISGRKLSVARKAEILAHIDNGHALWRAWCDKYGMEP